MLIDIWVDHLGTIVLLTPLTADAPRHAQALVDAALAHSLKVDAL